MLESILADKRAEVARLNPALVRNVRPSTRDLTQALGTGRREPSLFAEIARRDPFAPGARPELDVATQGASLQDLGIGALWVCTETRYWGGSRDDLVALDRCVQTPLVRFDFVVDELQLFESRRAGADAVVLQTRLLAPETLRSFVRTLAAMHMGAVALVHDLAELEAALAAEAPVIAVSNRDPGSGAVRLETTLELAPRVPEPRCVVSCYGIRRAEDVARLRGYADAILLESAIAAAPDPLAALRRLAAGLTPGTDAT